MELVLPILMNCALVLGVYLADKYTAAETNMHAALTNLDCITNPPCSFPILYYTRARLSRGREFFTKNISRAQNAGDGKFLVRIQFYEAFFFRLSVSFLEVYSERTLFVFRDLIYGFSMHASPSVHSLD